MFEDECNRWRADEPFSFVISYVHWQPVCSLLSTLAIFRYGPTDSFRLYPFLFSITRTSSSFCFTPRILRRRFFFFFFLSFDNYRSSKWIRLNRFPRAEQFVPNAMQSADRRVVVRSALKPLCIEKISFPEEKWSARSKGWD